MKVSVEFLEANEFVRKQFPDGWFWVREFDEDLVIQVSDDLKDITTCEYGWVEDDHDFDELVECITLFSEEQKVNK